MHGIPRVANHVYFVHISETYDHTSFENPALRIHVRLRTPLSKSTLASCLEEAVVSRRGMREGQ